jgi:two-component system sensor histidine kinase BaeS
MILRRISLKITLFVFLLSTVLLTVVGVSAYARSERAINENFTIVSHAEDPKRVPAGKYLLTFRAYPQEPFLVNVADVPSQSPTGTNLAIALAGLTLAAMVASLIIGFGASLFTTGPLHSLNEGLARLEDDDYKFRVKKVGTLEFDRVVDRFNLLAARLSNDEELRRNLVSDTSHELKTPVMALSIQLKGMRDGVIQPDPEHLRPLVDQIDRLADVVERLQEYTEIRSRTITLQKQPFDLVETAHRVGAELGGRARSAGMSIRVSGEETKEVTGNSPMVERMLINLVDNAIKYSGGTTIELVVRSESFSVQDDGDGIPPHSAPHVFERFYRADASRSRDTGGLGLGLAIVKEIAEAHGWKVRSFNSTMGGACFMVYLR